VYFYSRRLFTIARILAKYRIPDAVADFPLTRPLKVLAWLNPFSTKEIRSLPLGARLRMMLEELGPIYVKFGQIVSTRRDLLPPDIANELAQLQEKVPPFPSGVAVDIIEKALGKPLDELYAKFERTPLASASIAQVHAATLHDGSDVVVKVLRPNMRPVIERDVALLQAIARFAERHWEHGPRLRPTEVVEEFEKTIFDELDLQREAANCSLLRRQWLDSDDLYIPEVHWSHTHENVFTMERIYGIAVDDMATLSEHGVDMKILAERGVRIFYTQVFKHNFFHADMHPGNIKVSRDRLDDPYYLGMDFGIMGTLSRDDQAYLAANFSAFFNQDYRRVAELHVESGWVPPDTRIEEFEAAIRTVCEPNFARPLSEISFGEVLFKLFKVARRFNMVVQPQLVLLQKTLLNIEGLGRQTYPELDLWTTAKPTLEAIMREKHGVSAAGKMLRGHLPQWLDHAPDMPMLIHEFLRQQTREGRARLEQLEPPRHARPMETPQTRQERRRRLSNFYGMLAAGGLVSTAILLSSDSAPWTLHGVPTVALVSAGLSLLAIVLGWRAARPSQQG
jgi:ubiquinone biosynthesis protein